MMIAHVDVSQTVLQTERLVLRPFCASDLQDLYDYASVAGVGEKAGWKHHESLEESKRILDMFIEEKKTFALVSKETGCVIGSLGIEEGGHLANQGELKNRLVREIGYVLAQPYWGQGLMKEAVDKVIEYCFTRTPIDTLLCSHFIDNHRSQRVIEKCGFHYLCDTLFDSPVFGKINSKTYIIKKEERLG